MGWKQIGKMKEHIYVLLSENQCGMETNQNMDIMKLTILLSENQCGMETYYQQPTSKAYHVEREPMWDGNARPGDISALGFVEREPMWDGNGNGSSV